MIKKHVHYLDYLRTFAIIGVLVIHTSTPYVGMFNKIEFWKWETSIIYSSLIRWCVPIFFMVSGALLLGRNEEPLKDFFLKRGNRILVPFVIWTGIYFIWRSYFWNTELSVREFISLVLNNDTAIIYGVFRLNGCVSINTSI
jgi:surface polysaccharide O-acyltransferase-like enzyme